MILPDVNVLIFSFRRDTVHHAACRKWLLRTIKADAPFGISPLALAALVRITTNPRLYQNPSKLDEAFAFCEALLEQPNVRVVEPGERHREIFQRLCLITNTRGADTSDAWYAALAIESGCEWITCDRDFARFPDLRWRTPESSARP
jgi:toxin-antitoxin system PIN domain toxin